MLIYSPSPSFILPLFFHLCCSAVGWQCIDVTIAVQIRRQFWLNTVLVEEKLFTFKTGWATSVFGPIYGNEWSPWGNIVKFETSEASLTWNISCSDNNSTCIYTIFNRQRFWQIALQYREEHTVIAERIPNWIHNLLGKFLEHFIFHNICYKECNSLLVRKELLKL